MKKLLLLVFLSPTLLFAQKLSHVDSLKQQLNTKLSLKNRLVVLNEIAFNYAKTDSAQAYKYALTDLPLAEKSKDYEAIGSSYRARGIVQSYKNNVKAAVDLFTVAAKNFALAKDENREGEVYNDIGIAYKLQNQKDDAIVYFNKAVAIHRKGKFYDNLSSDLNNLGTVYRLIGSYNQAVIYLIEAAEATQKAKSRTQVYSIFINIADLLTTQKNYAQAEVYLLKAIEQAKSVNDGINMAIAYLNYANVSVARSRYPEAIERLNLALAAFQKSNFDRGTQICYNNLGAINIRQKHYEESIPWLEKSLRLSETSKNFTGYALTQQNLALALTYLGRLDEAEKYFDESVKSAVKYKADVSVYAEIYDHRATLDSIRGDFKKAFASRNRAITIKDSFLNEKMNRQVNELQTKYETERKQQQIEKLNHQATIQKLELTQSKLKVDNQGLIIGQNKLQLKNQDLELNNKQALIKRKQLETEHKQQQITILNRENVIQKLDIGKRNTTIGIVSGLLVIALILGALFYNRYKLKQEARLQAEVIRQQDLATQGIIEAEERERKRIAGDLHDGVGQLFSVVKLNMSGLMDRVSFNREEDALLAEKTIAMVDESCREVRGIAHQMMPNILLKTGLSSAVKDFVSKIDADKLKVTVETSGLNERLSSNVEIVLYRIIQECVNNVIKHAQASRLDIQLDRSESEIAVTIEDNGKGFDTGDREKFDGIGLKNILTRLAYLKGTADFSSAPGKGTLVAIYVPLEA